MKQTGKGGNVMCLTGALNNRYIIKANDISTIKSRASRISNRNKTRLDRLRVTGEDFEPVIFIRTNTVKGYRHIPGKWCVCEEKGK